MEKGPERGGFDGDHLVFAEGGGKIMNLEELGDLIEEKKELMKKLPPHLTEDYEVALVVHRRCKGKRCRLAPGVVGEIVRWEQNSVVAMFRLSDLEDWYRGTQQSKLQ